MDYALCPNTHNQCSILMSVSEAENLLACINKASRILEKRIIIPSEFYSLQSTLLTVVRFSSSTGPAPTATGISCGEFADLTFIREEGIDDEQEQDSTST